MNAATKSPSTKSTTEVGEQDELLESLEEALAWAQGAKALRVTIRTNAESLGSDEISRESESVRIITGKELTKVVPQSS